ncbi:hypothetical protein IWQ61_007314 [Dispira simplex]|nr:hypothetical protein IWQ61_007314 [Dispira simplex]
MHSNTAQFFPQAGRVSSTTPVRKSGQRIHQVKLLDMGFLYPSTERPDQLSVHQVNSANKQEQYVMSFLLKHRPDVLLRYAYLREQPVEYHQALMQEYLTQWPTVAQEATTGEWNRFWEIMYAHHRIPFPFYKTTSLCFLSVCSQDPADDLLPSYLLDIEVHPTVTQLLDNPETLLTHHPEVVHHLFIYSNPTQLHRLLRFIEGTRVPFSLDMVRAMMLCYGRQRVWSEVYTVYERLKTAGIRADHSTFTLMFKFAFELNHPEVVTNITQDMMACKVPMDVRLFNMVIRGIRHYKRAVYLNMIMKLVRADPHWNMMLMTSNSALTTVFTAYSHLGLWPSFNELLDTIHNVPADTPLYTTILHGLLKQGKIRQASELLQTLQSQEPHMDSHLVPLILKLALAQKDIPKAKDLMALAKTEAFSRDSLDQVLQLLNIYAEFLPPLRFHRQITQLYRLYLHRLPLSVFYVYIKSCFRVRDYTAITESLRNLEIRHPTPHLSVYLVLLVGYGSVRKSDVWLNIVKKIQNDRVPITITVYGAIMNAFNFVNDPITVLRYFDYLVDRLLVESADRTSEGARTFQHTPLISMVPNIEPADNVDYGRDQQSTPSVPLTNKTPQKKGDTELGPNQVNPYRPDLFNLVLPKDQTMPTAITAIVFNALAFTHHDCLQAVFMLWRDIQVFDYPMELRSYMALIRALGHYHVLPQYITTILAEIRERGLFVDHVSQRKIKRLLANHQRFYGGTTVITAEEINTLIGRPSSTRTDDSTKSSDRVAPESKEQYFSNDGEISDALTFEPPYSLPK